jgi:DNA invertase Pin-like site-specific DNA recombinase
MRAGIYLRISLDRTGEGLAVDRQREDCEQLIKLRGWQIAETFVDNDTSAAGKAKRPGFDALLAAVDQGRVGVVVSWSLDRLTRNRRDQLRLIEMCQRRSVNLALVRGADMDLSSAVGRAVADILSATARLEIEQKSERQILAIRQQDERGRMVGGRRAFGYSADGLELDEGEAALLRAMYNAFLSGMPLGSIAAWLNEAGVSTPRGGRWRTETVRVVLANPRNAGWRAMRPVDPATGRREFFHAEPVAKGNWPAVVSDQTWRATVTILKDPARRSSPGNTPRYLLSGIARCGWPGCGAKMFTSQNQGVRTLRCSSRRHVSRRADMIEAFVERQVIGYFAGPGRNLLPRPEQVDVQGVREEAAALRSRLAGLAGLLADGTLEVDAVRERSRELKARLAVLDGIVAEVARVDVTAPLRAADDPGPVWDGMTLPMRREVLRVACRHIRVLPGRPGQTHGVRFHEDTVEVRFVGDE